MLLVVKVVSRLTMVRWGTGTKVSRCPEKRSYISVFLSLPCLMKVLKVLLVVSYISVKPSCERFSIDKMDVTRT